MKLSRIKKRILAMIAVPISFIVGFLLIAETIVYAKWMFILLVTLVFGYILWVLTDELID
jgi:hypothetical protein